MNLLQTASINKGVEKSKNEGKFSVSNSAVSFQYFFFACRPDDDRST